MVMFDRVATAEIRAAPRQGRKKGLHIQGCNEASGCSNFE